MTDPTEELLDAAFAPGTIAAKGMFPTPLVSARLAGHQVLDVALAATILARERVERGVAVSNDGGWHSAEFASWCGPAGQAVLDAARGLVAHMTVMRQGDALVPAAVGWVVTAWANVNRAGHGNRAHAHPGAYWSGIYWVDDGGAASDPACGGMLELADPRGALPIMVAPQLRCAVAATHGDGEGERVIPEAGTMVLFPSWLVHSVTPYAGSGTRISVAFNLSVGRAVAPP